MDSKTEAQLQTLRVLSPIYRELSLLYRTGEANIRDAIYDMITLDELNDIMVDLHVQIMLNEKKL